MQIDGVSYGTIPAEVKVTPGVHRIEVSYPPYYIPFERREAKLFDGQTFATVLQLTDEGRALKEPDRKILNEQNKVDDAWRKFATAADEVEDALSKLVETLNQNGLT